MSGCTVASASSTFHTVNILAGVARSSRLTIVCMRQSDMSRLDIRFKR